MKIKKKKMFIIAEVLLLILVIGGIFLTMPKQVYAKVEIFAVDQYNNILGSIQVDNIEAWKLGFRTPGDIEECNNITNPRFKMGCIGFKEVQNELN